MNTKINYKCRDCGEEFILVRQIGSIPNEEIHFECGGISDRLISTPTMIDKIEDSVSFATQKMIHSNSPAGKEKSVL